MSLKKYITESERAQAFMVEGDVFTVGVNEELAVEFDVVSHTDNSVVVEADELGLQILEHCGCQMIADEELDEDRGAPSSECCDAPLMNYENGLGICSDCKEHAGAAPEELDEAKVGDTCSCCDNKIDDKGKCGCGPDCKHCGGQHDINEADSHVHDGDMDKAADYKRKAAFHKRMGNDDAANYYQKKVNDIFGKGLNINRALEEDADDAADAIKRRIMNMDDFSEMVRNYGIERIVNAINDEAEDHDDDELGSSDVSAMVNNVIQSLERSKTNEAEYQGREVKLGKPTRGDVKKYKVYVKDPKTGNVKKVNFGDPNMEIRRDNPKARKNFRARHNCSDKKDRTKAGYWSCRMWSSKPVSKIV